MSVDKTPGINHNIIGQITGNRNLTKPEELKKAASEASRNAHTVRGGDKVEISIEAKELHKTLSSLKAQLGKIPDIRDEKIKEVKANIEDGVYDSDEVIKEVARSIKNSGLI